MADLLPACSQQLKEGAPVLQSITRRDALLQRVEDLQKSLAVSAFSCWDTLAFHSC
jgi:hypothetical protein